MSEVYPDKKVVSINLGNFGSTGAIMTGICKAAEEEGYIAYRAYPVQERNLPVGKNDIIITNKLSLRISKKLSYMTGYNGCFAIIPTIAFLRELNKIKPDIIHLHNLHNSYINLPLLFRYIKKNNIKVIWTLHDCWSFTGHCPHFTMVKCEKWRNGCGDCPQPDRYPRMKRDRSKEMWKLKKKWFNGVNDLTLITPSEWLANLVRQSFLKDYPVKVVNNGIDLSIFQPSPSDAIRKILNTEKTKIILGVAFDWGMSKGLDVFIRLSEILTSDYQIVLIGTDDKIDEELPENIISIHRTKDKKELAQWYTAAVVFVNPTREDTFPTVNIEALACGTPVVTFRTGGSPEMIDDNTGAIVECDDMNALIETIADVCNRKDWSMCISKAADYEELQKFKEYIKLY